MKKVFETIYQSGCWGRGSGLGSLPDGLKPYYLYLDQLVRELSPATVVDFGCGYFAAYESMNWHGARYIGIDVVRQCIEENQPYATAERTFINADWLEMPNLPTADLAICKDVLQHWCINDVWRGLRVLSKYRRCLITNSIVLGELPPNHDIKTGEVRPLNLMQEPFLVRPTNHQTYDVATNENDTKLILLWEPDRNPLPSSLPIT